MLRPMGDVLALVEARLRSALGEPDARAAVTFLGTDRIEVLRFTDGETATFSYTVGTATQSKTIKRTQFGSTARPLSVT